ncbi:MAG: phosphatidylserine decarboxylase family protein [Prolixibacteraceae bacterium]|nr:phosphatidylserine decarboxylase family protein [Prolixibacteraceae bacterium]MBN2775776.1 phosphatidylserine decarboxylase family protein [Prolixibacteraceae bacterium]
MKIHREGKKIIPIALIILLLIGLVLFLLIRQYLIFYILLAGIVFLFGMIVWFFREPRIEIQHQKNQVLSVADGDVVAIEPHFEREYFKDERIQVSVFMSVFNVHINRIPIDGEIVFKQYRKGRYLPAFIAKSSEENERCTTVIKTENGEKILVRQIAGLLARRVITYYEKGDKVKQSAQLGFIRFGSRVDVFLPKNAKIEVKLHHKVFGGKTVIATLD